jgi:hypothetical protein
MLYAEIQHNLSLEVNDHGLVEEWKQTELVVV